MITLVTDLGRRHIPSSPYHPKHLRAHEGIGPALSHSCRLPCALSVQLNCSPQACSLSHPRYHPCKPARYCNVTIIRSAHSGCSLSDTSQSKVLQIKYQPTQDAPDQTPANPTCSRSNTSRLRVFPTSHPTGSLRPQLPVVYCLFTSHSISISFLAQIFLSPSSSFLTPRPHLVRAPHPLPILSASASSPFLRPPSQAAASYTAQKEKCRKVAA